MRRRDKPLDIYKKLQILRSINELVFDDEASGTTEKTFEPENFKTMSMKKKKLNIPVGDVKIDPSYDQNVSPDFVVPQSYVRYTKKIGDEEDCTIDYCLEQDDLEWIEKHPKLNADSKLTGELVEKVFNVLERNTGTGDPLDMMTAEKLVSQIVAWKTKPASLNSIFVDIYQRWIYKRNLLHRPLCRRYWPQTSPSDTNPHNVFRPREKERYRLRKHRKNDLHSFRKLQSLRRELGKARVILQLVVERELMKQAQLELQSRILDCRVKYLQLEEESEDDGDEERENGEGEENEKEDKEETEDKDDLISKYRYRPRYEHLIPIRDNDSSSVHFAEEKEKDSSGLRLTLNMKSHTLSTDSIKKQSGRPRKREPSNTDPLGDGAVTVPTTSRQRYRGSNSSSSVWKGDIPGLPISPWPSFMEPLATRQQLFVSRDMSEYMKELEIQPGETPYKYRCRGRIGRGGRVVMDRIPVYRSNSNSFVHQNYHLPTQLSSLQSQLTHQRAAEFFSLSLSSPSSLVNPNDNLVLSLKPNESHCIANLPSNQREDIDCYHSSLSQLQSFQLFYPPERSVMNCIVTSEEREIYTNSDSEDEVVEIRHIDESHHLVSKIIDPTAVKYSFIDV